MPGSQSVFLEQPPETQYGPFDSKGRIDDVEKWTDRRACSVFVSGGRGHLN